MCLPFIQNSKTKVNNTKRQTCSQMKSKYFTKRQKKLWKESQLPRENRQSRHLVKYFLNKLYYHIVSQILHFYRSGISGKDDLQILSFFVFFSIFVHVLIHPSPANVNRDLIFDGEIKNIFYLKLDYIQLHQDIKNCINAYSRQHQEQTTKKYQIEAESILFAFSVTIS